MCSAMTDASVEDMQTEDGVELNSWVRHLSSSTVLNLRAKLSTGLFFLLPPSALSNIQS
jgi:hypothetical protein